MERAMTCVQPEPAGSRVFKSCIPPVRVQRKPSLVPSLRVVLPTTWPESLIPVALPQGKLPHAEVFHSSVMSPKKWMLRPSRRSGLARNLTQAVDRVPHAVTTASPQGP